MDTIGKTTETTIRFNADVKEFKAAIKDARQSISLANAEFKIATAGASNWSNSVTGLESKLAQLNTVSKNQRTVLDNLNKELEAARRIYGEDSEAARGLAIEVAEQQAKVAKCDAAISRYTDQLEKAKKKAQQEDSALGKLNSRIDGNEKNIQDLVQEYKNAVIQYGKNSSEAKDLARQIKDLTGAVKDDKKEMEKADKAAADLTRGLDDVDGEARSGAEGFSIMKGAISKLVADGIQKLVGGLKDVAKQTIEAGSNLESELAKVGAISGADAEEMERLKKKAMEMGANTKFTATEAAEGFEYMAMAGWKTEDMVAGLDGIMNLAAASGEDLATTSDIITDALTAFGASAEDSGRLADIIAAASSNANTNVSMMGETFKYVAPVAGALGYSMEDASLAIGLMANAGIKSSQAGTSLRAILTNLASPTKSAAQWMDKLGITIEDESGKMKPLSVMIGDLKTAFSGLSESEAAAAAKAIAGKNGMSGLLAMVNGSDEDFNKLAGAIANCSGTAQEMADTMNDTVEGQVTLLKSKVEGIMVGIYDKASGSMRKAIDTASRALDKVDWDAVGEKVGKFFEKLADGFEWTVEHSDTVLGVLKGIAGVFITYKTVKTVGNVAGAFKDFFGLFGPGVKAITSLGIGMEALPFAALVGSIGAVVLADIDYAKSLRDTMEQQYGFTDAQKEVIEAGADMVEAWKDQKDGIEKLNDGISLQYTETIPELLDAYNDCIDKNGDVKKSEEERAEYILTQLSEALGIEKEDILKLREANGKFGESIDEVIKKQQAQMVFEANKSEYEEALKRRKELNLQYADTVGVLNEKYEDVLAAEEAAAAAQQAYDECVANGSQGIGVYREELDNANEAVEFAKEKYHEAEKAVRDQGAALAEVNGYIKDNQGLSAAIITGDAEQIEEATRKVEMSFVDAESGSKEALMRQVQNTASEYERMKQAVDLGVEGITEDTLAEYKKRYDLSVAELEKYRQLHKDEALLTGDETVAAVKLSEDDVYNAYKENQDAGTQGIKDAAPETLKSVKEVTGGAVTVLGEVRPDSHKAGRGFTESYGGGIAEKKGAVKTSVKEVTAAASEEAAAHEDEGRTHGANWSQGFANGIGSKVLEVAAKVRALTKTVKDTTAAELDEHSPSRVGRQQGRFYGEGLGIGITESLKSVRSSVKGEIGSLLTDTNRQLKAETPKLMEAVNAVRSGVAGISVTPGTAAQQGPASITFVQNNNSPKALDRLSIYRDTNSLLFGAKYAMGG